MDCFLQITILFMIYNKVLCTVTAKGNSNNLSVIQNNLKSAGFNEDALLDFTGLTKKYGYPTEEHAVITSDGYNLTLFRIKGHNCSQRNSSIPLLLMHGLIDTSTTFIIAGPKVGLAYLLADQCHDVWLPNIRGNTYSKRHIILDSDTNPQYWNFTFDEFGMFDLPAIVDYVLNETKTEKLNYIAHSQGNTIFYILASTKPEYNSKFNVVISLAPVAWTHNTLSPILQLKAFLSKEIKALLDAFQIYYLFDRREPEDKLSEFLCQYFPQSLCGSFLFLLSGVNPRHISPFTFSAVFGQYPSGTSVKNIEHYGQLFLADKFRRYNYGRKENMVVYGRTNPPEYDLSKVTAPVVLICGENDWVVSLKDVAKLRAKLPNVLDYQVIQKQWSHPDFVWSKLIPKVLAPIILKFL